MVSLIRELLAPQEAEFPNRLRAETAAPGPSLSSPGRKWVLPFLLLAAFLPRAYLGAQITVLCDDGAYFVRCAEALDRGNLSEAFGAYAFNLYPIALAGVHRLGLDWESAGRTWGILITTLLILPLYGLLRRQFDERIAVLSCLLYAAHPNLIEWSPELIRCNQFFFAAVLAAYCSWRAATEASLAWYLAAGISVALAAFTRAEGWLLLIPLLCWTASRWRHFPQERRRLAWGLLLAIGFLPALFILTNLTLLATCPQWSPIRVNHVQMLQRVASRLGVAPAGNAPWGSELHISTRSLLWLYLHKLELGVYWLQGLFLLGGIIAWRRVWLRQDQQPLFYVCALQLALVAFFLVNVGVLNSRYFFLIPILGSPYIALGLLSFGHAGVRLLSQGTGANTWGPVVAGVTLATVCCVGVVDGCYNDYHVRVRSQRLGQFLRGLHCSPVEGRVLVLTRGCCPLITSHYATRGVFREITGKPSQKLTPENVARAMDHDKPALFVLERSGIANEAQVIQAAKEHGFECLERGRLPTELQEFLILSRDSLTPNTAAVPAPTTR